MISFQAKVRKYKYHSNDLLGLGGGKRTLSEICKYDPEIKASNDENAVSSNHSVQQSLKEAP